MKYYNYKAVGSRITDLFPDLKFEDNALIRWCAQLCMQVNNIGYLERTRAKLTVVNHIAELPCDLWKLVNVTDCDNVFIKHVNDGVFLKMQKPASGEVYITYDAIKKDKDGLPVILYEQIDPCAWNAIYNLYQRKFMAGEINGQQWEHIESRYEIEHYKALYSRQLVDDDKYRLERWIQRNVIWNPDNGGEEQI